jgi:hypothetical protein
MKGRVNARISFEALAVISNMRYRVNEVAEHYGETSPEHVTMLRSLAFGLHHVMQHGGTVAPYDLDPEQLSLIGGSWVVWRLGIRECRRRPTAGRMGVLPMRLILGRVLLCVAVSLTIVGILRSIRLMLAALIFVLIAFWVVGDE